MSDSINELVGKTLTKIEVDPHREWIRFKTECGKEYMMCHHQDCCENVEVDDICGDISDLIGAPILQAEMSTNRNEDPPGLAKAIHLDDSFTWTFYRITTAKGQVVLRWLGESNGYYSEEVDFDESK